MIHFFVITSLNILGRNKAVLCPLPFKMEQYVFNKIPIFVAYIQIRWKDHTAPVSTYSSNTYHCTCINIQIRHPLGIFHKPSPSNLPKQSIGWPVPALLQPLLWNSFLLIPTWITHLGTSRKLYLESWTQISILSVNIDILGCRLCYQKDFCPQGSHNIHLTIAPRCHLHTENVVLGLLEYHCQNQNLNYIDLKFHSTFFQMCHWGRLQSGYALNNSALWNQWHSGCTLHWVTPVYTVPFVFILMKTHR